MDYLTKLLNLFLALSDMAASAARRLSLLLSLLFNEI